MKLGPPVILVVAVAALASCRPDLELTWADRAALRVPPGERYPDAPAVLLEREERFLLFVDDGFKPYFQVQRHDVVAVLTEKGFDLAAVTIDTWKDTKIVAFQARTILPDGTERLVRREDLIDATGTGSEGALVRTRRFHFPQVEVGSILEHVYTTQTPGTLDAFWRTIQTGIPIERYTLEVVAEPEVQFEAKAWKVASSFELERVGGMNRMRLDVADVPAVHDEPWRPDAMEFSPRWIFRVLRYVVGPRKYDAYSSWGSVVKKLGERIRWRETELGYRLSDEVLGMGGWKGRDVVDAALRVLRKQAEFRGFSDPEDLRSLPEVLASGEASASEKAYLARALLVRGGIRADLAFLRRRLTGEIDRAISAPMWFNHVIVYVPRQDGVPEDTWIDPSCESCAPGQLPPWSRDVEVFRVSAEEPARGEFTRATGLEAVANLQRRTYDAVVAPSGDLRVKLRAELAGSNAVWKRAKTRGWDKARWTKDAEEVAAAGLGSARVQRSEPFDCDREKAICRRKLSFVLPAFATKDDDRLIVPLGLLKTFMDEMHRAKERHYDFVVADDDHLVDELRLRPPAGYTPEALPEGTVQDAPGLRVEVSYHTEGDVLVVRRSIHTAVGHYPQAAYDKYQALVRSYEAVRRSTVVFRRTASAEVGGTGGAAARPSDPGPI